MAQEPEPPKPHEVPLTELLGQNPKTQRVKGRSPDFILKLKRKSTGASSKAGAAWITEKDGAIRSITIRLDVGATIPEDPDILITLFPQNGDQG